MYISLPDICKDLYCILRFHKLDNQSGPRRGRELEKIFEDYCLSKSLRLVDRRGSSSLFGYRSLSGANHEIDGSLDFNDWKLYIEMKAYKSYVPIDQLLLFQVKSLDYYFTLFKSGKTQNFFRAFISGSPLGTMSHRFCHLWSIVAIEPNRLPIPVILEYLRNDKWKCFFEFALLQEVERVLPRCSIPLDKILVPSPHPLPSIYIKEETLLSAETLDQIEEIHLSVSDELLEVIDGEDPDHFERHTAELLLNAGLVEKCSELQKGAFAQLS